MSSDQQFSEVNYADIIPSQSAFHIDEIIKNSYFQCKRDFEYSTHKNELSKVLQ